MNFELTLFTSGAIKEQAAYEIMKCNDYTGYFGLSLTKKQAIELVETRSIALSDNGRIEFGGGVIDKIIKDFCDSPYISMQNYTQTINELIETFYYYKNETMDLLSDDELIEFMKSSFDDVCQGSLDLLQSRELYRLRKNLILGLPLNYSEDSIKNNLLEEDGENNE